MAKPTKVKYNKSDDKCESDDCRCDDKEDYSKDELIEICEQLSFVKGNDRFCNRCKQVGHIEQDCKTNKNK
jgi:hypothetical protein